MEDQKKDYNEIDASPNIPATSPVTAPLEMSKRSRLNKHLERKSRRTLIISILAIVLIVLVLFKFGIPFIADLGFLSSQVTSKQSSSNSSEAESEAAFISVPTLNPTFDATNSAKVEISGTTVSAKTVAIYLNGTVFKKLEVEPGGNFELTVNLSDGDNIIKAKSINGTHQSDFSDSLTILLKNTPPTLSIDSVHDGDTVNTSPISISGKTDSDTKVTVNGFWAIVDSQGGYTYSLNLQNGDNQVVVSAIDSAGNKTEKTIKLTYSH